MLQNGSPDLLFGMGYHFDNLLSQDSAWSSNGGPVGGSYSRGTNRIYVLQPHNS